jgi:cellulose synthase/poly-beta-1,6-N-acetylglucosamine synthase-like glycosyltransferase/peptidoglycan/xylan/chitin deacetylase (PgdA/CDA1 family)
MRCIAQHDLRQASARVVLCPRDMTTILLDPTMRRARIMRATVAVITVSLLGVLAICAIDLRAANCAAPTLPSPRHGGKSAGRRPVYGQRRRSETATTPLDRRAPSSLFANDGALEPPAVIAFLDPSVKGAISSLQRNAPRIASVAMTGLVLGDDGNLIDRIDRDALRAVIATGVPRSILIQNLDLTKGGWDPERVRTLMQYRPARARLAMLLRDSCLRDHFSGVHIDLEDLDDDWPILIPILDEIGKLLRPAHLELAVDLPAEIDGDVLGRIAAIVDRVVIMAYDEHDQESVPGPIASDMFVAEKLRAASLNVPTEKLVAGLAIYGYDWIGSEPAEPLSFVDAHTAAKEAHVAVQWDLAGNSHFRYSDDEGHHDVWLADAASVWNQARIAATARTRTVALWRLGGEDPAIWAALAAGANVAALESVAPDARVDNVGDGPFLSLTLQPEAGRRELRLDHGRIVDEQWRISPSPYLVRRAGIVPGKVALTFDDGPDAKYTPQILDILKREHVPASFFVIGSAAAKHPELVQRAFAEGHEIGNHSFTHPDVATVGQLRLRTELESTSRLLETIIGRRPLLYRPPSLADIEPRTTAGAAAFSRAGQLGYLVIDADVDPRDWEQLNPVRLAAETVRGADDGGVVLLHDGGGNRSTTVQALPTIINELRQRGLEFVPLGDLVNKKRDEVMPPAPSRTGIQHVLSRLMLAVSVAGMEVLHLVLLGTLALLVLRMLFVIVAAHVAERRRLRRPTQGLLPSVTALVPAYNEAAVITRTIDSLLESDLPLDVIVIDDGSTDDTADIVHRRYLREPRVRLIRQANAGKAAALRTGFAAARTEVVVALDGDTLFARDTVRRLIEPMRDVRVGAVAGTAEVGNLENALTRWQALEYMLQQELERRAWDAFNALPIVPGAVGAWRRRAVAEAGGFSSDTFAEDADMAMTLCRHGWRVIHAPEARARTEAPTRLGSLVKQRVRWSFGILQALWKHRAAPLDERPGMFGHLVWPTMILFQVLLPLLTPLALIAIVVACLSGNLRPALITSAFLFATEICQFVFACALSYRTKGSGARLIGSVVATRLFYRPLLLAVTMRSLARLLDGVPLGWAKLARRNTVLAYAAITAATKRRGRGVQ